MIIEADLKYEHHDNRLSYSDYGSVVLDNQTSNSDTYHSIYAIENTTVSFDCESDGGDSSVTDLSLLAGMCIYGNFTNIVTSGKIVCGIKSYSIGESIINTQAQFDSLSISSGDTITLNGTFIGSIDITQDNVTITGGTIKGDEDISSLTWNDEGDGTWTTTMLSDPKWINIDGTNAKLAETGWINVTGTVSTNKITVNHADVSGYTSIVGSYIVFMDKVFSYTDRYTITAYNGAGEITLDRDRYTTIDSNSTFKLFNDAEYFVGNNEWIWRNNELRVKSTVSPSTLNITKSTYDYGINVTGNNCTINNVNLKNQYLYGVKSTANGTTVSNCDIRYIRGQGIKFPQRVSNVTVSGNTFEDIGHNGMWFAGIQTISITNNMINNIGVGNNIGWNNESFEISQVDGTAIKFNADLDNINLDANNITISYNTIDNCAYNGISMHIGDTGTIRRNVVTNTNQILEDGGCIYCFHYRGSNLPFTGFVIEENFVTANGGVDHNFGIYMDNRCGDNEVSNNVVIVENGDGGIMINADTYSHNVHHNTVYQNRLRGLWYRDWAAPSKLYSNDGNLINNNILIAKLSTVNPMQFSDGVNPYTNGGSADNNIFVSPYGTTVLRDGSGARTLASYQSAYSQDANAVGVTDYIAAPGDPDNEILIVQNPSDNVLNGTAPSGNWYTVDGTLTTNYSINAWGSLVLLKDLI